MICVDASVAVKWVMTEPDSDAALALYEANRETGIIAPPFMPVEVTNAIWRRASRGLISNDDAEEALTTFWQFPVELSMHESVYLEAMRFARRFSRPTVYDMHYVALAQAAGCELWTADRALVNAVGAALPFVRRLSF